MGLFSDAFDLWLLRQKVSILIGGFILLCVSACSTYNETRYMMFGKETLATVTNAQSNTSRNGSWSVKYEFDDNGLKRMEEDYGPEHLDATGAIGNAVEVEYVPGSVGSSRLAGTGSKLMMIPFLGSLIVLAVVGWKFMREYREHERRSSRYG